MSKQVYSFFFLTLLVVVACEAYAQPDATGFYVLLDRKKECTNPFKSLSISTPMCLSKNPIITEVDFESVSTIHTDSLRATKYISLKISKEAYGKVRLMAKKLPRTNLVLVVDGTIIGIISNLDTMGNPIPIYSDLYSSEVDWVFQKLKKVRPGEKL
jgi:hypothetical protein